MHQCAIQSFGSYGSTFLWWLVARTVPATARQRRRRRRQFHHFVIMSPMRLVRITTSSLDIRMKDWWCSDSGTNIWFVACDRLNSNARYLQLKYQNVHQMPMRAVWQSTQSVILMTSHVPSCCLLLVWRCLSNFDFWRRWRIDRGYIWQPLYSIARQRYQNTLVSSILY